MKLHPDIIKKKRFNLKDWDLPDTEEKIVEMFLPAILYAAEDVITFILGNEDYFSYDFNLETGAFRLTISDCEMDFNNNQYEIDIKKTVYESVNIMTDGAKKALRDTLQECLIMVNEQIEE